MTILGITAAAFEAGLAGAVPAAAGGVGDLLSPAFGTLCSNLHNGAYAHGATTTGTGTAGGTLLGLPLTGALNQCGGADLLPAQSDIASQDEMPSRDKAQSEATEGEATVTQGNEAQTANTFQSGTKVG